MSIRSVGWLLALAFVVLAPLPLAGQTTAPAGEIDQSGNAGQKARIRPEMWRSLSTKCAAETARFCPTSAEQTPQDKALCLKFYKTSLSLGCRGAVNAVAH